MASGALRSPPERNAATTPCLSATGTTGTRAGLSQRSQARSTALRSIRTITATPRSFRGKNVVILGMGNSAMDIAVECSYVASKVYLAARAAALISFQVPTGPPG